MLPCPTLTDLIRLREAGSEKAPATAEHLQDCPDCRQRFEQLSDDEQLAADLRRLDEVTRRIGRGSLPAVDGYELIREIGRGGMGVVYEAVQLHLGRVVALKVLPAVLHSLQPDSVRRFKAEAAAAAQLCHPNIVPIYDYGEEEACHYYAMELIRGVPLSTLIQQQSEQALKGGEHFRRVARWMAEVADALQAAHDHGVVHRDIKPSNLILSDQDRLMVTDFGLVKELGAEDPTRSQHILGTWRYMSPEQARGDQAGVDHRADVYSLGATLYETLTRQPAAAGRDDHEILRSILERDPVAPRKINPAIPRALEVICLKAMAKQAASRYPSAAALRDDLQRFLDDRPIRARRPLLPGRLWMFARRHRLMVALAAVVVLLVTSVFFASAYLDARLQRAELQVRSAAELVRRANDLAGAGQLHQAAVVYTLALQNDPALTYVYRLRARALARIGQFQACIQDLDTVIQHSARRDRLLFTRGVVQLMMGERRAARADFNQALAQNPGLREARVFAWLIDRTDGRKTTSGAESGSGDSSETTAITKEETDVLIQRLEGHLAGAATPAEILASASDPETAQLARCALGSLAAVRGDTSEARVHLEACAADQESDDIIPVFCRWQLERLPE